jgi:actin-related protein
LYGTTPSMNWKDLEEMWRHCFFSMKCTGEDRRILLVEPPMNPKSHRERMTHIMMEKYQVSDMHMTQDTVLSLYAAGRTTGCVVKSGYSQTTCQPIYEGYTLPHAATTSPYGGASVTHLLKQLLELRGYTFRSKDVWNLDVREIKESVCFVKQKDDDGGDDRTGEATHTSSTNDHLVVAVGRERHLCTEALFQPSLFYVAQCWSFIFSQYSTQRIPSEGDTTAGEERTLVRTLPYFLLRRVWSFAYGDKVDTGMSVQNRALDSIMQCEADIRTDLLCNVVLSGGNTMFDGFAERLEKELFTLAPPQQRKHVKVVAPPFRKYSSWIGGSIVSSLSTFSGMWISDAEYNDSGPTIVHRKCF